MKSFAKTILIYGSFQVEDASIFFPAGLFQLFHNVSHFSRASNVSRQGTGKTSSNHSLPGQVRSFTIVAHVAPNPNPMAESEMQKKQQIRLMEIIFSTIFPIIFLGQLVVLSALGASLQAALARILKFYPLAIHYSSSIVGYAITVSYWLSIC